MAKTGRLSQPTGGDIAVGPKERAWFKKQREDRGLGQDELATRIGWSQGSVSNFEKGKHPTVNRVIYAKLVKVLGRYPGATTEDMIGELVGGLGDLAEGDIETVMAVYRQLKKSRENSSTQAQDSSDDSSDVDGNRGGPARPPRKST